MILVLGRKFYRVKLRRLPRQPNNTTCTCRFFKANEYICQTKILFPLRRSRSLHLIQDLSSICYLLRPLFKMSNAIELSSHDQDERNANDVDETLEMKQEFPFPVDRVQPSHPSVTERYFEAKFCRPITQSDCGHCLLFHSNR
jgi:hypothetical protein